MFPAWRWLKRYDSGQFKADFIAALIVIAILIPQGMAYAIVAGLPPITGLYASVLPMMVYACLGGSATLSIGPVALISMMVYATLNPLYQIGSPTYIQAACLLALLVGLISLLLGIFRFGFLIRLISHPVIKSFIIASALLIALSQFKLFLAIPLDIENLAAFLTSFYHYWRFIDLATLALGLSTIALLLGLPQLLRHTRFGHILPNKFLAIVLKLIPLLVIILIIIITYVFALPEYGIQVVGEIPAALPPIAMPFWSWQMLLQLLPGAFMIAMVSFVESISIAQATAFQNRHQLNSNQELIALGVANISAGISAAFPVTGSLSRTVVNADAGAKTPLAGFISSIMMMIASFYLSQYLQLLPLTVLAATIIVSIWKLVDFKPFIDTWRYSKADGIAMWITFFAVLFIDISTGLILGIASTFLLMLWRVSRPHIAVIGRVQGTQHFRNIQRHQVITTPELISIRIDESLNFLNVHTLKEFIIATVSQHNGLKHVIINCSSISNIDLSALESLEDINHQLQKLDIALHFSEVKGPVMDKLQYSTLPQDLTGQFFLTHYQAVQQLQQDGSSPP
ncbi:sodium-independent anion transporter [Acinetobacter larvae]|uniref:Sodium-independent anion transporter n=1 Tax=Acinetobacter larvae TaxID=1789224 RepID=A0A1B2M456_9GAMM|nr:sodium-independent anion transporter [Acinetobacter larvae]